MQQKAGPHVMSQGGKRISAAFDRGQVPTITLINKATTPWGIKPEALMPALQRFVDECVAPVWGTPCTLELGPSFRPNHWAIVFLDDADAPEALGYHELTPDGLPLSKVFVRTVLNDGEPVSAVVSHELAEMLVDPAINLSSQARDGRFYAYEVCDAVEGTQFFLDQVAVSNFVYPSWFEGFRARRGDQYDYLNLVSTPFELLKGGYMPVFDGGEWTRVFASDAARTRFEHRAHGGRRAERRGRVPRRSIGKMEEASLGKCTIKMATDSEGLVASGRIHRRGLDTPIDHPPVFVTRATSAPLSLAPGKYDYRFIAGSDSGDFKLTAEDASGQVTDGPASFTAGVRDVFHFEVVP